MGEESRVAEGLVDFAGERWSSGRSFYIDKMYTGLVLLLITIIQETLALSKPSKRWKVLKAVVENGMYGWNLTIRRGMDFLCDIPAVFSLHNATCYDNVSRVFLHSIHSLHLLTEATNKTFFLEYDGKSPKLNDSGIFESQEEALSFIYPMVNLNNSAPRAAEDLSDSNEDLSLLKIVLPIIILIIIIAAVFLWKKWRNQRDSHRPTPSNHIPSPENQPLNSQDTYTALPISNTQNDTHMTHSNGVLSGQDICMVPMDSSKPPTFNAVC
ncbi:uncharacterized protein LOC143933317 [Lithobates pipiens]